MTRVHLKFLDGLRGAAALYVVLFHLISAQTSVGTLPAAVGMGLRWLRYGQSAVDLFIVLSGYCLMLPVARSADGRIPGGAGRFLRRRGRRILPPMWAALAFTLAMILLVRTTGARVRADDGTAFAPGDLLAHALLVHNWFRAYSGSINLPLWTVAVEWQIYFLFPLLLVPLWRAAGSLATVAVAAALGLAPRVLLPASYNFDWTRPWYLGLFAMGMAAAAVHFGSDERTSRARRFPWGWAATVAAAAVVAIEAAGGADRSMDHLWAKDLLVGTAAAATLAYLAGVATAPDARRLPVGRLLARAAESRPAVALGAFSYSLYLTHFPLIWAVKFAAARLHLSPAAELAIRLSVAPAAIAAFAFGFYWVFERPFVSAAAPRLGPVAKSSPGPAVVTVAVP